MNLKEYYQKVNSEKSKSQDVAWLIKEVSNVEPFLWGETELTPQLVSTLDKGIKRLSSGEPLGYILGYVPFWNCKILVTPDVLIPRAETEQLCELVVDRVSGENLRILDLCTGSGCIAVALATQLNCKVVATDISEAALKVAKQNAVINNVQVDFICGDLFKNVSGKFDVIVTNPPYIAEEEKEILPSSVLDFEPHIALFGGDDGLDFYKRIKDNVRPYLSPRGMIFMEVGDTQAERIVDIFDKDFDCEIISDYFGFKRFVIARSRK